MRLYVGITDYNWFTFLASKGRTEEVNFWRPSAQTTFKRLQPGELFLFKLHAPNNFIVGGGFFIRFLQTPISLAWRAFGEANGVGSLQALRQIIGGHRAKGVSLGDDPIIGCILLGECFFFSKEEWIPSPVNLSSSIVQGKSYELTGQTGLSLWEGVRERLQRHAVQPELIGPATGTVIEGPKFGTPISVAPRLGQGAFRLLVTDAYNRRCAVTQERILPVLEAAHIRRYSSGGEHSLANGLLLRSDLHRLFDLGYLMVDPGQHTIEVSHRLKEEFENGRDYYALQGRKASIPIDPRYAPSRDNLLYHASKVFR
jgi:putative restriction endonuclease